MADVLKQLATTPNTANNKLPTGTSNTLLYTVPALTSAMVSRIIVCNQTASAATFRIALVASGGTVTNNYDWIAYDISCPANDTINFAVGAGMATGDMIYVRSGTGSALSFSAYGIEVS